MPNPLLLIVDDEPSVRTLIAALLRAEGFETVEAEDGVQALRLVRTLRGTLALLISDIRMPNMDGLTLANAVRTEFPALPIILISAYTNPVVQYEFIRKPFLPATFLAAVRKAMVPKARTAGSN